MGVDCKIRIFYWNEFNGVRHASAELPTPHHWVSMLTKMSRHLWVQHVKRATHRSIDLKHVIASRKALYYYCYWKTKISFYCEFKFWRHWGIANKLVTRFESWTYRDYKLDRKGWGNPNFLFYSHPFCPMGSFSPTLFVISKFATAWVFLPSESN